MHGWFGTINGVVLLTVAASPAAALAVWRWRAGVAVAARRGGGRWPRWASSTDRAVGLDDHAAGEGAGVVPGRVSLVPLRDLLTVLASEPLTVTVQIVGNLLVFAAVGFLAPLRFAALASVPRILVLAAGCSVLVEIAQYALRLDRVSSVDDVLLNTAGAGLAALASRRWWREPAAVSPVATGPAPVR
ncbi:VanZ family protein [Micromonospora sp. BRA006-A]|nr:VanZ family protein [Micromonospora sp. BRA006-A]